jgi:chemotaxis protein methyltransferase CheR
MTGADDDSIGHEIHGLVLAATGLRADEGHLRAVRSIVSAERGKGVSAAELRERAMRGDPELIDRVVAAVSVPETYFFRQPQHFEQIVEIVLPRLAGRPAIRAWSAGCATGEEAYSLASCLLATAPEGTAVEVLGTDLSSKNIAKATLGVFGPWSLRVPLLYPLLSPPSTPICVSDRVRAATRFETHSVLEAPPGERTFDLILCRNVLLYLSAESVEIALRQLARALSPGGFILFGSLDLNRDPPGLLRLGPLEANIFTSPPSLADESGAPPRARLSVRPELARPDEAIVVHRRAQVLIDGGDRRGAEQLLERLVVRAPTYVPGLLEYALLHVRSGRRVRAGELMRELLDRLESLPGHAKLAGPEELPVDYYRIAAQTYLDSAPEVRRVGQGVQGWHS